MKIRYTRHAKSRMRWRGISKEEIELTLQQSQRQEIISNDRFHFYRRFGKRWIRVTCVVEDTTWVIISAVDKHL